MLENIAAKLIDSLCSIGTLHTSMSTRTIKRKATMSGTIRARMKCGQLELLEKVDLPEGREVSVTIIDTSEADDEEAFTRAAGSWKDTGDADALIEQIYANRDRPSDRPVP
ncbi:MAG: antitoxin family protein, partial [Candidatus Tectomicrobia bacterium]|nr:antitoxin family protein [Candidatus Tectomicrobia bacterium]